MVGSRRDIVDRGGEGPHERCVDYFGEDRLMVDTTAQVLLFKIRKALPEGSIFNIPIAKQIVGIVYNGCIPEHASVDREIVNVIAPECGDELRAKCGNKCIQVAMASTPGLDRSLAEISSYRESVTPVNF